MLMTQKPSLTHTGSRRACLNKGSIQDQTCQKISQTGSVCLPVAAVEEYKGFVGRRTSKTLTEPSYEPTASRLGCCGWKSRHITPVSPSNSIFHINDMRMSCHGVTWNCNCSCMQSCLHIQSPVMVLTMPVRMGPGIGSYIS